jgi:hypothetical protein
MYGDRRFSGGPALRLSLLLAFCASIGTAQVITSLQSSPNPGSPSNVTSITINAPQSNGTLLYINGTFDPAAALAINWTDNTNGILTELQQNVPPTANQLVAIVPPTLFTSVLPSTVQIQVLQNANPSNIVNYFLVNPATTNSTYPNAFVGSAYGPVTAVQGGTAPYSLSGLVGNLPPGITFNPNTGQLSSANVLSPPGPYTFGAKVTDFWGVIASPTLSVSIQSIGTPTLSTFTSSAGNTYPYGTLTNLSITVGPINASPPFSPNIIQFFDNNTLLGSASAVPASGLATLNNVFLTAGTHNNMKVAFIGDQNWQAVNTGPFVITVQQASPNVTFAGSPFSATYGGTLSAGSVTVAGAGGPTVAPTGNLTVTVASSTIATFNGINPGGVVTANSLTGIQLPASVGAGAQTITYAYPGDTNYSTKTGGTPLTVNKALPTANFIIATNPIGLGQLETFTASIKAPGLGTPGGNVTFLDGVNPIPGGTVALNPSGIATFSTSSLSPGVHSIGVQYGGDNNFLANQSQPTSLTVTNNPLTFLTTSLSSGVAFQSYSAGVTVTGGTPPYIISATGLPAGLNINPQTGAITGTPLAAGNFSPIFTAVDSVSTKITLQLGLVIALPPVQISTTSLPNGTVGVGYSATIGVTGGTSPVTYGLIGTLPPGLNFISNSALITGIPTTTGTYTFTVKAIDAANSSDTRDLSITIKPAPLSFGPVPTNPTGTTGTPININLGCTGGVPPYTYSVTGSLPPGVTFANCIISGTPTQPGTFLIHILITDTTGASITRDVTITVAPPGLSLAGGSLPDGQVGVTYNAKVAATGGVQPITYASTGLPDGLSMATTGDITGTPTTAGPYAVRVTAKDSSVTTAPVTVSATYTINIAPVTLAFGPANLSDGVVGVTYSGSLSATGGTKPYRFTATGLPDGLTLGSDGSVSGAPLTAGTFTVAATVTDAASGAARATYTITIAPRPVLAIQPGSAPNGTVGTQYSVTFTVTGSTASFTFSATGQPSTLTMSAAGTLSGTPTAPGSFTVVVTAKDANGSTVTKSYPITISLPSTPPLNFAGINTTVNAAQQPRVSVALGSPFPVDVQVTLTLSFQADSGPADPAVVFSTGGTTTTITIPAGSLNGATDVGIQTGTVAGTITITAKLTAAGTDVTPSPTPTRTAQVGAAAPVIVSATGTRTSTGFTITVTGYVTDREMTTAVFGFNGSNLGTSALTVTVDALFAGWLSGNAPPSANFGSQFTYTQPFNVNGSNTAITTVAVTLNNKIGASNTVTVTLN